MTTRQYFNVVESKLRDYIEKRYDLTNDLEIIQVWYCKTIQNHKGLFIVKNNNTNSIYPYFVEVTYNGDKKEFYFDYYSKFAKETWSEYDFKRMNVIE